RREVQPVLRDQIAAAAPAEGSIVEGLGKDVLQAGRKAVVKPPPELNLGRFARGIAVGGEIVKSRGAIGAWIRADGVGVGQELLPRASALDPYIRGIEHQAGAEILLHRNLPSLRITGVEMWIDAKSVRDRWRGAEAVGQRQQAPRTVLHDQALRERRLLRHLAG